MQLIDHKCPNCGARVEYTEDKVLMCHYCGSKFDNSPIENNQPKFTYIPPRPRQSIDMTLIMLVMLFIPALFYTISVYRRKKRWSDLYSTTTIGQYYINHPEPQLSWILMIFLFNFAVIPGFIYLGFYKKRHDEWEMHLQNIRQ